MSFVIGQSQYFGFGFSLNWKPIYAAQEGTEPNRTEPKVAIPLAPAFSFSEIALLKNRWLFHKFPLTDHKVCILCGEEVAFHRHELMVFLADIPPSCRSV